MMMKLLFHIDRGSNMTLLNGDKAVGVNRRMAEDLVFLTLRKWESNCK